MKSLFLFISDVAFRTSDPYFLSNTLYDECIINRAVMQILDATLQLFLPQSWWPLVASHRKLLEADNYCRVTNESSQSDCGYSPNSIGMRKPQGQSDQLPFRSGYRSFSLLGDDNQSCRYSSIVSFDILLFCTLRLYVMGDVAIWDPSRDRSRGTGKNWEKSNQYWIGLWSLFDIYLYMLETLESFWGFK